MPVMLPDTVAIARHETFHIRDSWLLKGLNAIARDPLALSLPGAHHDLGVGKNMLSSIRYWVQATGLAAVSGPRVGGRIPLAWTDLAHFVIRHDPFLEDIATLWLLHIELASRRDIATFWYWAFNEYDDVQFSEDDLAKGFVKYVTTMIRTSVNERSVRKDVSVFLRTYKEARPSTSWAVEDSLDCPLTALRLLTTVGSVKPYAFVVGAKTNLPLEVVAYTFLRYRDLAKPGAEVISLDELRWAPHGPGRLLLLDAPTLLELGEALEHETQGTWLRLSQTAGLRNLHLGQASPFEALARYYERGRDATT